MSRKKGTSTLTADRKLAIAGKLVKTLVRKGATSIARYEALRRDPSREHIEIRLDATETEQIFRGGKRVRSYTLADQLYDNDAVGATVDTAIRLTIGSNGGNPQFTGDGKKEKQAVWDVWKRHAGFAEGEGWQDILGVVLRSVIVHGDCLVLIDKELTGNKIRIFDADQITPLVNGDFEAWCDAHNGYEIIAGEKHYWHQCEGAVLDTSGRTMGWFVTMLRNRLGVNLDDATFIPSNVGRLVRLHKKISQYRGESLLLPNEKLTSDTRSLISSEVQSARNHAEMSIILGEDNGDDDVKNLLDGIPADQLTEGTGITADDLAKTLQREAGDFEAFAGKSSIARVAKGTEVHELNNQARPSNSITQWMQTLNLANGQRLGVMSCLSLAQANNSYSSGQIELAISWATFAEYQKMLERQVVDYAVEQLFGSSATYSVRWTSAFEIDPAKAESTIDARLAGGRTTYRQILGDDWKETFDELAQEMAYAKQIGIADYLTLKQTASGAQIIESAKQENTEDEP